MFLVKKSLQKDFFISKYFQKNYYMAHIRNKFSLICLHIVTKSMDFISKSQGYIPLKAVPYIFFLAVVLSITTSTNTFV
ncbi:hypothetical protein CU308_01775 [Prochlorococcus marinus str. MU1410]|nr:hypothetical protein [Prochlorococcus marinus str. MU1410]